MRILEGIFSGWSALKANKLRSLLTMLGIVIGTGGVIGTISFGDGARQLVMLEVDKIGGASTFNVHRPSWVRRDGRWIPNPSSERLSMRDVQLIETYCPSVEWVAPDAGRKVFLSNEGDSKMSDLRATTGVYQHIREWSNSLGRFLEDSDVNLWNKVVVIGSEVASDLFGKLDPVGEGLRINNQRFTVVGVMESKGGGDSPVGSLDNQVFVPYTTAHTAFWGGQRVDNLLLKAFSPELREKAEKETQAVLRRHHGGDDFVRIYSQAAEMESAGNFLGNAIQIALGAIAAMSLLIAGIGILNIMLVSVAERVREIGLRKAVGATRVNIAVQFLVEGAFLCLMGSLVGVFFGWLTERALAFAVVTFVMKGGSWPSLISWTSVALSVSVGSLTGVVASAAPAVRAAKLPPVDALRHQ